MTHHGAAGVVELVAAGASTSTGGSGVQGAGGLVGQDQGGIANQGPGHRHPLLLAARQLTGPVVDPVGQTHLLERLDRPAPALGPVHAGVDQGQLDVAPGRQRRPAG